MLPKTLSKNNQNCLLPFWINHKIISAISHRHHKNMSLVYGDTKDALNNRRIFLESLGIDYQHLVCARQIHGNTFRYVQEEDIGKGALSYDSAIPDTDALITDKPNLPLAVFTADCLSVFLYDPKIPAVGLIHAGWHSTQKEIIAKTVQFIRERFNTAPENLYVGFGPAIRGCCYEVKEDFRRFFPGDLIEKDGHFYLDLVAVNKKQLLLSGVKELNIFDSHICTSCQNGEFFSYRKEGNSCARMISVMMLR